MGTYDHQKVISEYENGRMDLEMATGHSLQHIGKLYELQTVATINHYEMRGKIDTFENTVNALQKEVARLTALVEKFLPNGLGPKRQPKSSGTSKE